MIFSSSFVIPAQSTTVTFDDTNSLSTYKQSYLYAFPNRDLRIKPLDRIGHFECVANRAR